MKQIVFVFFAILLASCLMAANPTSLPSSSGDDTIKEAVKQNLLADEKLSGTAINVDVHDGVVTLKGKVIGHEEAARALELAKNVTGVVQVKNNLEVVTTITNDDVEERLENKEENLEELKEQTEPNRSLGTVIDDATISAAVKMKFAKDDLVRAYKIDVDTKNGEVTLTGTVKSDLEATRAIELSKSVEGVKKVTSVLVLKP